MVCFIHRYFQYQTAEVRFERRNNNQDEGIVVVPGRFNNPIWEFNDSNATSEEESGVPDPPLNNQSATNITKKKKNTNVDGVDYLAVVPSNVEYNVNDGNDDDDDDDEGSYGYETRQEPVDLKQYVDCLVIGTYTQPN